MARILSLVIVAIMLFASPAMAALKKSGAKDHDSTKPIEINADNLEVDQAKQTAIFSGKVEAVQGEMRLYANKMVVYYRDNEKNKTAASSTATTSSSPVGGAGPSSISKVEVEGNVLIKTPEETARGDRGVYDVSQSTIRLTGKITLTQGPNIIQGDALVYNMDTGKSEVSSDHKSAEGTAAKDNKPKGRVKSVFVPSKKE